jgi:hypothetical protein
MCHNASDALNDNAITPLIPWVITPLMMYDKTTDDMRDDATDDVWLHHWWCVITPLKPWMIMSLMPWVITPLMMCDKTTDDMRDDATDDVWLHHWWCVITPLMPWMITPLMPWVITPLMCVITLLTVCAEKDSPCTSGIFVICICNIQLRAKELKVKAIVWLSHSHCDIRPWVYR